MSDEHKEILTRLKRDRVMAHTILFRHRHPNLTPPYIADMIQAWHDDAQRWVLFEVFRGGAKSTTAEEAILIKAAFREIKNYLIVGATKDRAFERLHAIRYEIEQNDVLAEIFGDLRGSTWGDGELVLSNGVRLLAMGKGQSLRGVKYLDARPDGVFADDLEEPEDVRTPEARSRTLDWFLFDLIPALDVNRAHARVAATPLDPEALPCQLVRAGWVHKKYPVEYNDAAGNRAATWPDRVPLSMIDEIKANAVKVGKLRQYNMEYMCEAEVAAEKSFKQEMFRVEPQIRTWQAVYGFLDPARVAKASAAHSGFVSWSWIGNRLVVWDAWGKHLHPNEQIAELFAFYDEYHPAWIGVEEDGLNEWLLQPIRQESSRRNNFLPLKPVKAPVGKLDFIRNSLQPFFNAREVWFAKPLPELQQQLLSFPTGKIDIPNALAYAVRMRPGQPMYEDFGGRNVMEDLKPLSGRHLWLAFGATRQLTIAVLLQQIDGALRIYMDWVREGDPGELFQTILQEANLEAGGLPRLVMGPLHFDQYNNVGLRQAAAKRGLDVRKGTPPELGRVQIREMLKREIKSMPAILINPNARWTANGFAGGYARVLQKGGMLADFAEEGPYRVVMEALESFTGLLRTAVRDEDDESQEVRYDYTSSGRKFVTARR